MDIFSELMENIVEPNKKLSSTLKKALIFAYKIKSDDLKNWLCNELDGYKDVKHLPEYRKLFAVHQGMFTNGYSSMNNAPISLLNVPADMREVMMQHNLSMGIRSMESMLENSAEIGFKFPWPAEVIALLSDKIYSNYTMISAWQLMSRNQIEYILDSIRNRFLKFLLQLQETYPEIENLKENSSTILKNRSKITNIFNTYIYGNENVVTSGDNFKQILDKKVDFGGATVTVNGDFAIAQRIQESFNKVVNSDANQKIKEELTELAKAVITLCNYLPDEKAKQAAQDLEVLSNEVISDTPRKKWYELSAESLIEAAKSVGENASSVIESEKKLLYSMNRIWQNDK